MEVTVQNEAHVALKVVLQVLDFAGEISRTKKSSLGMKASGMTECHRIQTVLGKYPRLALQQWQHLIRWVQGSFLA